MPKAFSCTWQITISLNGSTYRHSFKRRNIDIQTLYKVIGKAINRSPSEISLYNNGIFSVDQGTLQGAWAITLKDFLPFRIAS